MSEPKFDLALQRNGALKLLLAILWVQVPLTAAACWLADAPWLIPISANFGFAVMAQLAGRWDSKHSYGRVIVAVCLMVSIEVLLGAMSGQKLQVDLHMYIFAAMSVLIAFCDWRVIVAGATVVSIHHIILNFLVPSLIYPGGADVSRLVLHAAVLVLEAIALGWVAFAVERMFAAVVSEAADASRSKAVAEANAKAALSASQDAQVSHERHDLDRKRVKQEDDAILEHLAEALQRLAQGDLVSTLDTCLPDKAESLRSNLNATIASLRHVMQSVVSSAASVRSSADEISTASGDLSRRTEQQAASLEETAAALDEITATVRKTAEGSKHAREIVGSAKTDAEYSGNIVRQAVEAMSGIETSSGQISQIIGVIDEIAFQTNLLALNAGVEAARAGDAGRGFAVVASEVRALAQRSADAAKEIKALISSSGQHVAQGVDLVKQTGHVLAGFVGKVVEINSVVSDIAASVQEQATSLEMITRAVNQMDQMTQQNAAMVEQSTAASQDLSREMEDLNGLVAQFKLGHSAGPVSPGGGRAPDSAPMHTQSRRSVALKSIGRGGAVRKPEVSPDWQEF